MELAFLHSFACKLHFVTMIVVFNTEWVGNTYKKLNDTATYVASKMI